VIAIIQCAGTKRPHAGQLLRKDGKRVRFVADPAGAPPEDGVVYARPDDISDRRVSWRSVLLEYNREGDVTPFRLVPAWRLYRNDVYARLVRKLGIGNVYILSAGWGLIAASFLTPDYDITFSKVKREVKYKQRRKGDRYDDFNMLPDNTRERVVFFGGKDYLPLFSKLTWSIRGKRTVFFNSKDVPNVPGCELRLFETDASTNWHYLCANAFVEGNLMLG
jgi:hypothetical protein